MNTINKIQVDGVNYDIQASLLTKVTYTELKEMRDNGSLVAGHLYRITDYEFTTKQSNTKSAGNVFDIIVLATAENQLSELARAIQHEGDTYLDGNDLGAWELWYDLDNDTTKYRWADAENGKGVIYRMIDEKRNDCPYDFKNALFYNEELTTSTTSDKYYYTFSYVVRGKLYDGTIEKQVNGCHDNSMGVYSDLGKKCLNLNVFINTSFSSSPCYSNKFGNYCHRNTFGNTCCRNTFGSNFSYNTFGDHCDDNNFGNYCSSNKFRGYCSCNTFGYGCSYNIFGEYCNSNKFRSSCSHNTFDGACQYNNFGDYCQSNKFRDNVRYCELNFDKTSITLNDEYYNDGSGQLVPIKHPDLSTQPSILPYKFMGQYVYEQLIPMDHKIEYNQYSVEANLFVVNKPVFLEAIAVGPVKLTHCDVGSNGIVVYFISDELPKKDFDFIKVVYTSMPEEGDYYGYNNY